MALIVVCVAVLLAVAGYYRVRAKATTKPRPRSDPKGGGVNSRPRVIARVSNSRLLMLSQGRMNFVRGPGLTIRSDGLVLGSEFVPYGEFIKVETPDTIRVIDESLSSPETQEIRFERGEGVIELMWRRPAASKPSQIFLVIVDSDHILGEIQRLQKESKDESDARGVN